MTTEEILKAATPRPWEANEFTEIQTLGGETVVCDCCLLPSEDVVNADENAALIVLAVNAYERDQAKIKALVEALWQAMRAIEAAEPRPVSPEGKLWASWEAALKLAGGE